MTRRAAPGRASRGGTRRGAGGGSRGGVGGHAPRAVIESRAVQAWELDAAGYAQREIATLLHVTQPAVCKMLRRMADTLIATQRDDQARQRVRLIARNDRLYREALRAYERSQQTQTRRRQRQTAAADGTPGATVLDAEVRERDGDPRFLEQAGRAVDRAVALHGLDPSGRRADGAPDGDPPAARDRLARVLDRVAARAPARGPAAGSG